MNKTAAPRYADNEAQNHMDIWVVEQRVRAERLATDRLTRATKALVWATGVLALAAIALRLPQLSDGYEKVEAAEELDSQTGKISVMR